MSKRILVVEHDEAIIEALEKALKQSGLEPVAAYDPVSAVKLYERTQPDGVLLAVRLGPDSGAKLCGKLRTLPGGGRIPILFIGTAAAGDEVRTPSDALAAGGDYFFRLPTDLNYLAGRVAGWTRQPLSYEISLKSALEQAPKPPPSSPEDPELMDFDHFEEFGEDIVTELDLEPLPDGLGAPDAPEDPTSLLDLQIEEPVEADGQSPSPEPTPSPARALISKGEAFRAEQKLPEAVDAYRKAAQLYEAEEDPTAALALYKLILHLEPKDVEACRSAAEQATLLSKTDEALSHYERAADLLETQPEAALEIVQKMLALSPGDPVLTLRLAKLEEQTKAQELPFPKDKILAHLAEENRPAAVFGARAPAPHTPTKGSTVDWPKLPSDIPIDVPAEPLAPSEAHSEAPKAQPAQSEPKAQSAEPPKTPEAPEPDSGSSAPEQPPPEQLPTRQPEDAPVEPRSFDQPSSAPAKPQAPEPAQAILPAPSSPEQPQPLRPAPNASDAPEPRHPSTPAGPDDDIEISEPVEAQPSDADYRPPPRQNSVWPPAGDQETDSPAMEGWGALIPEAPAEDHSALPSKAPAPPSASPQTRSLRRPASGPRLEVPAQPAPPPTAALPLQPSQGAINAVHEAMELLFHLHKHRASGFLHILGLPPLRFIDGLPNELQGPGAVRALLGLLLDLQKLSPAECQSLLQCASTQSLTQALEAQEKLQPIESQAFLQRLLEDALIRVLYHQGPWTFEVQPSPTRPEPTNTRLGALLMELLVLGCHDDQLRQIAGSLQTRAWLVAPLELHKGSRAERFTQLLDGKRTLEAAAKLAGLPEPQTRALVAVLHAAGAILSAPTEASSWVPEPASTPPSITPALAPPKAPAVTAAPSIAAPNTATPSPARPKLQAQTPIPTPVPTRRPTPSAPSAPPRTLVPHRPLVELEAETRLRALLELVRTSDYFTILGIDWNASKAAIDEAHYHLRSTVRLEHFRHDPNLLEVAQEVIRGLDEARDVLSVPELKTAYQQHLRR